MFNRMFDAILTFLGWCLGIGVTLILAGLFFFVGLGWLGFIIVFLMLCGILEAIFDATGGPKAHQEAIDAAERNLNPEYYETLKAESLRKKAQDEINYTESLIAYAKQPTPNAHKSPRARANAALKYAGSFATYGAFDTQKKV